MGAPHTRQRVLQAAESLADLEAGIARPVGFGPGQHQALNQVYYCTVKDGAFVPLLDWSELRP
jgi:hypothetical protein